MLHPRFAAALILATAALPAHATSVSLAPGLGDLTLYGQGAISPGIGSFRVGQGVPHSDGVTSTFTLSGAIAGGDAGFDSGTYALVTTYAGPDSPDAGPGAPIAQSNPSDTRYFFYDYLDPTTSVTLLLNTPGEDYVIPLVTGGNFVPGTGYSFLFASPTCTGVSVCNQNLVGLTPGATITGPVSISASFTFADPAPSVPETATWAMVIIGVGVIGAAARNRRVRPAYA